jgi:hypothetical protein
MKDETVVLKSTPDKPTKHHVTIPSGASDSDQNKIKGWFAWGFVEKNNQKEVIMVYKLSTPFSGMMADTISLFHTA